MRTSFGLVDAKICVTKQSETREIERVASQPPIIENHLWAGVGRKNWQPLNSLLRMGINTPYFRH